MPRIQPRRDLSNWSLQRKPSQGVVSFMSHDDVQVMRENRLLEQEIRSVRELRVGVASWLLQGSAMGGSPLCRQFVPGNEVIARLRQIAHHVTLGMYTSEV